MVDVRNKIPTPEVDRERGYEGGGGSRNRVSERKLDRQIGNKNGKKEVRPGKRRRTCVHHFFLTFLLKPQVVSITVFRMYVFLFFSSIY